MEMARIYSELTGDATAQTLASKNKFADVYTVITSNSDKIFALTENDVDTLFSLAIAGLSEAQSQAHVVVKSLANALSADATTPLYVKLNLLKFLFNFLDVKSALRYEVYSAILKLVIDADIPQVLAGQFANLDSWLVDWKLTENLLANVYYQVSVIHEKLGETAIAQQYLMKSLKASENTPDVSKRALKAALYSITTPAPEVCLSQYAAYEVLLAVPAVRALANGPDAAAVRILELMQKGSIADYTNFAQEKSTIDFFAKHEVDAEVVRVNVVALCVADACTAGTIKSYDDLKTVLGTKEDVEVEEQLVESIFLGQISGKLNQKEKTVRVDIVKPRTFTAECWKELLDKVVQWKLAAYHTYSKAGSLTAQNISM